MTKMNNLWAAYDSLTKVEISKYILYVPFLASQIVVDWGTSIFFEHRACFHFQSWGKCEIIFLLYSVDGWWMRGGGSCSSMKRSSYLSWPWSADKVTKTFHVVFLQTKKSWSANNDSLPSGKKLIIFCSFQQIPLTWSSPRSKRTFWAWRDWN